ncbi:MAG TPA: pyocin knob domain-containing protein [Gaiellaceae bacterium]|jgi:hypothetical protein|nr:pyocin knob domain-containing protein [Gaiellaceae bacterium]
MTNVVVEPLASPDPATTNWVPLGPAGPGLPSPIVNGQWVKGSGGAAIWAPITQPDLPNPLREQEQQAPGNDANQAQNTGWYRLDTGAANGPNSGLYWHLFVLNMYGNQLRQTAYAMGDQSTVLGKQDTYTRRFDTGPGAWTAWRARGIARVAGGVNTDGSINAGTGFTVVHAATGQYQVTLTVGLGSGPVWLGSPFGSSTVLGVSPVSATQATFLLTTPSAWVDGGFYFVAFDPGAAP